MKSDGQLAYEQDVELRPLYHTGEPRKAWEELSEIARWSWDHPSKERAKSPAALKQSA